MICNGTLNEQVVTDKTETIEQQRRAATNWTRNVDEESVSGGDCVLVETVDAALPKLERADGRVLWSWGGEGRSKSGGGR